MSPQEGTAQALSPGAAAAAAAAGAARLLWCLGERLSERLAERE